MTLMNKSQVIDFIIEVVVADRFHCIVDKHRLKCKFSIFDAENFFPNIYSIFLE